MYKKAVTLIVLILLAWPLYSIGQRNEKYVKAGDAFLAVKDFQSALDNYSKAIDKKTSDKQLTATLYYKRAICELTLKQYAETIQDCREALKLNPQFALCYYFRGQVYDLLNRPQLALDDYNMIINIDSAKVPKAKALLYGNMAHDYVVLGEKDLALQNDSLAIVYDPQNSRAYYIKGDVLFKENNFKEAVSNFDLSILYFQGSKFILSDIFFERGEANRNMLAYKAAINDYSRAVNINPDNKLAYWDRAAAYSKHGDYALATNDYATAINYYKFDSFNLSKLYDDKALSEINANMLGEAIKDDSAAVAQNPRNRVAYYNQANAYTLNGNFRLGLDGYRTTLGYLRNSKPLMAQLYFLMAGNEYFLKDFDRAVADCDTSISLDSNYAKAYYYRAKVNFKKPEKKDIAIADFKKVLITDTTKSADSYIFALFYLGKAEKAVAILQQKLLTTTDDVQVTNDYYNLACLYSLLNQPDNANSYLKMAVDKGYSKRFATADDDLDNIRNTADYKSIIGDGK